MAEITMPKMSDTMEEGKLIRWLKREGDQVTEGEPVAEIETDKANVEMETFEPGVIRQILAKEGETIPVGQPIAVLEAPGAPARPAEPAPAAVPPAEERPPERIVEEEHLKASPIARRMAAEYGIDLFSIQGTGPDGRIIESDIEAYLRQIQAAPAPPTAPAPAPPAAVPALGVPAEERELARIRRTVAERMTRSKQTAPHFYVTAEVDMDWASRVRDELNADESQPRVSFTDLAIKACALALTQFPEVNASFSEGKLLLHKDINIGMAVALEEGLIAPVVHNADGKPLRQIAAETKELARRARENNLRATDYTGGTFTVSNLGMFDVESFISIINPPESASLAIGTVREVPIVSDREVAVSNRMKATLSADHRVLDGAVAARFLHEVKRRLESPIGLL